MNNPILCAWGLIIEERNRKISGHFCLILEWNGQEMLGTTGVLAQHEGREGFLGVRRQRSFLELTASSPFLFKVLHTSPFSTHCFLLLILLPLNYPRPNIIHDFDHHNLPTLISPMDSVAVILPSRLTE